MTALLEYHGEGQMYVPLSWRTHVNLKSTAAAAAGFAMLLTGLMPVGFAAAQPTETVPDLDPDVSVESFVVTYADGTTEAAALEQHAGSDSAMDLLSAETKALLSELAADQGANLEGASAHEDAMAAVNLDKPVNGDQAEQFMAELLNDDAVVKVEPNITMYPSAAPSDAKYASQWSLAATAAGINAEGAWGKATGKGVTVAVLDTGVIAHHPDLKNKLVGGYDFISNAARANDGSGRDADPGDAGDFTYANECRVGSPRYDTPSSWHGSHVAGIIAAETDNGQGIAGVARDANLTTVRVLGKCGGSAMDIADGIKWAAGVPVAGVPANPHPAKVINMSLGGQSNYCPDFYQEAIDAAVAAGSIIVAAAGNDGSDANYETPANCRNVITVGASGEQAGQSWFSNWGTAVDITAPGGDDSEGRTILSTVDRGTTSPVGPSYGTMQGTSQATPHIAGIIALMAQLKPSITSDQALRYLKNTAKGMTECSGGCGAGIADANAAVSALARDLGGATTTPKPTATATPKPTATATPKPTATTAPQPVSTPSMAVSNMYPYQGQQIDMQAWGFKPYERVTFLVDGWGYNLGTLYADGQGRVTAWWRVGYDVPRGYHVMYAVGSSTGAYAGHWISVR